MQTSTWLFHQYLNERMTSPGDFLQFLELVLATFIVKSWQHCLVDSFSQWSKVRFWTSVVSIAVLGRVFIYFAKYTTIPINCSGILIRIAKLFVCDDNAFPAVQQNHCKWPLSKSCFPQLLLLLSIKLSFSVVCILNVISLANSELNITVSN